MALMNRSLLSASMSRKINLKVFFCLLAVAFLCYAEASSQCEPHYFECSNGACVYYNVVCDGENDCGDNSEEHFCNPRNCHPSKFLCLNRNCVEARFSCDRDNDCGDYSDERYCHIHPTDPCPPGWFRCPNGKRCIPFTWMCNNRTECEEISEETNCRIGAARISTATRRPTKITAESPESFGVNAEAKSSRTKTGWRQDRWGSQVHRMAVALHLADNSTFSPGNSTGEDIRYELTMRLFRFIKEKRLSSQELALYIHALLVACMNPREFYGEDLVRELRGRVEAGGSYTNPFLILALCNAGDTMIDKDVERVTAAYDSQHRPFWTDYEALSSMALSCISSRSNVSVDESALLDMLQELKKRQFRNGTVENFRTTALVSQALFIHDSYEKDFDLNSAIRVLSDGLKGRNFVLDSYYALPVLSRKSLLNVTSDHCKKQPVMEEELQKAQSVNLETITVFYSVLMGDEINGGRTWRLKLGVNSTIYNAIEIAAKIDNTLKVKYHVVGGKPYVSALKDKEDDPEMGMFWFIYLKSLSSNKDPEIVEESPVDVILQPNQEIILWYKRGPWSDQGLMQKSVT